jgi:hypothetical protein
MKIFFTMGLLFFSLTAFAQWMPGRIFPAFCQNNYLMSNLGTTLYRFNFTSDCSRALSEARMNMGRFCDSEKLIREDGFMAHLFTFRSDCQEALGDLRVSRVGLYCNDGDMNQIYRGTIAFMTFESNCRKAINQSGMYRGLFCDDGRMLDFVGRILRDYTFNSSCIRELPVMSRTYPR